MGNFARLALSLGAAALLAGCGGSQPPIGGSGTLPQTIHDASSSFQVLLRFGHTHESSSPLLNVNGILYGTAYETGDCGHHACHEHGTVFRISATGAKKVLYYFKGGASDGAQPIGPLIAVNGTLYGTTAQGGSGTGCFNGCGTVYSISTSGSEKMLYAFQGGSDGANPVTGLVDVNGTLYGTTLLGGSNINCDGANTGCGTVYSVSGSGSETVLYRFISMRDGWEPSSALLDVKGTLYGTTAGGGVKCGKTIQPILGCGTVYKISTSGSETVLHRFKGWSGPAIPAGGLVKAHGMLYGMTNDDFFALGAVYRLGLTGDGYKVVYSFRGAPDGQWPVGALIGVKGLLYGVTRAGGMRCGSSYVGCGTIFSLTTGGKETVLYGFGGQPNGAFPNGGVTAVQDTFYGTTSAGGDPGCQDGCGTIFALSP